MKCLISYSIICIGESVIHQSLVPICVKYCLNCTKFGKLILRKIIKWLPPSARCHILRLKCTKFDFCWGSAPATARTHCGSLQRSPSPPSWIYGGLLLREGRGGRTGGKGRGRGFPSIPPVPNLPLHHWVCWPLSPQDSHPLRSLVTSVPSLFEVTENQTEQGTNWFSQFGPYNWSVHQRTDFESWRLYSLQRHYLTLQNFERSIARFAAQTTTHYFSCLLKNVVSHPQNRWGGAT